MDVAPFLDRSKMLDVFMFALGYASAIIVLFVMALAFRGTPPSDKK